MANGLPDREFRNVSTAPSPEEVARRKAEKAGVSPSAARADKVVFGARFLLLESGEVMVDVNGALSNQRAMHLANRSFPKALKKHNASLRREGAIDAAHAIKLNTTWSSREG